MYYEERQKGGCTNRSNGSVNRSRRRSTIVWTLNILLVLFTVMFVVSCGGGSEKRPCERDIEKCLVPFPETTEAWWQASLPDFSDSTERPVISLLGERTLILEVGDLYVEDGALAADDQDGNITADIVIQGEVNTDIIGDYLVRYAVTDSDGNMAAEQARVVRVVGANKQDLTRRPLGTSYANFAYFEHLPLDYGEETGEKPPLLIYFHGSGANLEFTESTDPLISMDAIIENYGIPKLIEDGQWDNNLPFVVLAPHIGSLQSPSLKDRVDAFLEYAIHTYDIDINRVYLTGWSSGGYISSAHAVEFPDKIAAIAPIASGLSIEIEDLPEHFCNIEQVPVWLFHGTGDQVTPFVRSIRAYNAIVDQCQPRVLPKLSLLKDARHHIHHAVLDLSALEGSELNVEYDPRYDAYDTNIYEWLLSHSLEDR